MKDVTFVFVDKIDDPLEFLTNKLCGIYPHVNVMVDLFVYIGLKTI